MNDLNHPKVMPFTREIASVLSIDRRFVEFVFAETRPDSFRYWVGDASRGWTCYVPDEFDAAYPLWSTNADQTLILTVGDAKYFGKGCHDNHEMELISRTTQGLLANLLAEIAGIEDSDEKLKLAAKFCGFDYLAELLVLLNDVADFGWLQSLREFIEDVDRRNQ